MNRRTFLSVSAASAAAVAAGASWARFIEPRYFELTKTRISLAGVRPRRILHMSDIHISDGMSGADLETGFREGLSQRPDLICLTGDFVSTTRGFDREGLEKLLRLAVSTAPTYAVLGNHDGGKWLARWGGKHSTQFMQDLIRSSGVHLLHNQRAVIDDLTLVGVGDYWSGEFDTGQAFSGSLQTKSTILLCHNPDAKRDLGHLPWDLMLSGHTHGGQVRVPGFTPPWAPVADKRFIAGLYGWNNRQLFITRGVGSPLHVRAFCRPEISVLDLV
ncbi:MAG: phosphodiesterase YaeI [Bryobacteraceae bacterium]